MKRLFPIFIVLFALFTLNLGGCTPIRAVIGITKPTDHFLTLASSPAIRYEPGAEKLAREIETVLPKAVETVQRRQGPFTRPVVIHATVSVNSFAAYCTTPRAAACVLKNRLFMAPDLLKVPQHIAGILTHELSHLQLNQAMGSWKYQTRLPAWFHEGLAVFVADGAGAESVDSEQAVNALLNGDGFSPQGRGSLFFQKNAHHYNMTPHMYYRQAALFIDWLHGRDEARFNNMFAQVQQGNYLDDAMLTSYGFNVEQGWKKFLAALKG